MNRIRSDYEVHSHNARVIAEITLDPAATNVEMPLRHRIIGADPRHLRGIPAIGRNVGGAVPGTRPDHLHWVRRVDEVGRT
jgi:hypothetical protein